MKSVGKIKKIAKPLAKEKFYINTQFALYYNKLRSLRSKSFHSILQNEVTISWNEVTINFVERSDYFLERSDRKME